MILKEKLLKDSSIFNTGNQSDFDITEVKGKRFYVMV